VKLTDQVFAGVGTPFVIVSWFIMPETARLVFPTLSFGH
jgi:hypothetical protein